MIQTGIYQQPKGNWHWQCVPNNGKYFLPKVGNGALTCPTQHHGPVLHSTHLNTTPGCPT
jgi:hypothetical protein